MDAHSIWGAALLYANAGLNGRTPAYPFLGGVLLPRWTTAWETAAIYVGAVVGAGFASGREIFVFFVRPGGGPFAAVAAGLCLGLAAAIFLPAAARAGCANYGDMCRYLTGRCAKAGEALLSLFLFAGLAVMLAAGATLIALHSFLDYSAGVVAMAALTVAIIGFGPHGLATVNRWLVPYLAIAVLTVAASAFVRGPGAAPLPDVAPAGLSGPGLWSLLLYVGYNFITGMAVLVSLPPADPRQRSAGALVGGAALGFMLGLAATALAGRARALSEAPLPLLTLAREAGPLFAAAYIPAIVAAVLTTAVADAYALAQRLSRRRPGLAGAAVVAMAMPVANQGFVTLVDHAYPLLGTVGLAFLALAFWRIARSKSQRG